MLKGKVFKYGVDINVGDTRGPAGIFRALRTIPVMLDICRDLERLCPKAILLNYTNPLAMLCKAIQIATEVSKPSVYSLGVTHCFGCGLAGEPSW